MPGLIVSENDRKLVNPKHICKSCTFLLNDPVQTSCGHFYCLSCVDDLKAGPKLNGFQCAVCSAYFRREEIFRDRFVRREIECLPFLVRCPKKGCSWKGRILQVQDHITNCSSTLPESSVGGCVYQIVGCKVPSSLTAEQLKEHNEKCADFHLKLILKYVNESSLAKLNKKIENLLDQFNQLSLKFNEASEGLWGGNANVNLQRRLTNTENSSADHGMLIQELSNSVEQLHSKVEGLEKQKEKDAQTISLLKNQLEQAANENPRNFPGTCLSHDDIPSYDGILLWKITDFARKRNEAVTNKKTSFTSPVFYTDRHGYKMCARIYLNGDGLGRGQCISLFFVIMRGEFDALLRWPFIQKVTMMLLDQDHVEHVIDAFAPDPASSSFKRPTSNMNIASGCPLFCPLADLHKFAYIKDDTMFVKIIVNTSDIY